MKKVLLTSTALVMASASLAFADVSLSGEAEMGVVGGSVNVTNAAGEEFDETIQAQFWNDVDVTVGLSGETDGGLAFGAAVELFDVQDDTSSPLGEGDWAVFISSDFGTLTLGDTDGALDFVTADMGFANPGSINDAETGHLGYLGAWLDGSGDGQILRYDYSFDAFTFAVSLEQGSGSDELADGDDDLTWAIGAGYDFEFGGGSAGVSLGYQYSDNGSISVGGDADGQVINISLNAGEVAATAVGASVELDGGFGAAITYTMFDFDEGDDVTHIGIGGGYSFDAFSVHANYGQWDADDVSVTGWGISAGYDLGGGASLLAGYGSSDTDVDDSEVDISTESYSFGLSFAF